MTFVQFSKEDCGEKMTLEETRKVQLDMLDALADFCDQNGLRYFLSAGTLLGAVRHQGFIPWDDDIDINMSRPDCDKLIQLSKGRIGRYILMGPDLNGFVKNCRFLRLYDFNTVIENYFSGATKKYPAYLPIFIDIFQIDGLPDGKFQTRLHYLRMTALQAMQYSSSLDHMIGKNAISHIFHVVSRIPAKLVGYEKWSLRIQKASQKYDFDSHTYVGVSTAGVHKMEEKVKKEDFMKPVDVLFEGKYYHAPGSYDIYLSQLYGDYMKMPPKEKQKSQHVYYMYWKKPDSQAGNKIV